LLHIMHLFPSDRPPSILFAKKFRIHDSFIATPPQKMRGTLRAQARKKTMRIWVEQSPFDLKDTLKRRGYRWSDGSETQVLVRRC
jgi:hypothetical protein